MATHVTVPAHAVDDDGTVVYTVCVEGIDGDVWEVPHRYSNFRQLYNVIEQVKGNLDLPHFPSKSIRTPATGSTNASFVLKRRAHLETWLQAVLQHEELRNLETTKGFLLLPPFANQRQLKVDDADAPPPARDDSA